MKVDSSFLPSVPGADTGRHQLAHLTAASDAAGPTVWLTAGVHGDEVGGIVVIQEVFNRLKKEPLLRGTLHAFPLLNPLGFETASRHVPVSEEDLNRAFPGKVAGTLGERMAHQAFTTILASRPALVLDLHNDWTQSVPYTLIDPAPASLPPDTYQRLQQTAAQTGFVTVLDATVYTGTLSYSLLEKNIPALSMELGESYIVNERNIIFGVQSIWSCLASLGLVKEARQPFHFDYEQPLDSTQLTYSDEPLASASGLARFLVKPGQHVAAGQDIARIFSPIGELRETLRSPHHALLLGHTDYAAVFPGLPVMSFGVF